MQESGVQYSSANKEIQQLVIEKHLEYQLALVNRRWQYFATYLLVNGLLFNAWKDAKVSRDAFTILIALGSIVMAIIFLQLTSVASERIEKSQVYLLGHSANVFDYPLDGRFTFKSTTILLYFAFISFSTIWFYLLLVSNRLISLFAVMIFVVNLFTLSWRPKKITRTN